MEETRERLGEVTKDPAKYKKLLQDLVVQVTGSVMALSVSGMALSG